MEITKIKPLTKRDLFKDVDILAHETPQIVRDMANEIAYLHSVITCVPLEGETTQLGTVKIYTKSEITEDQVNAIVNAIAVSKNLTRQMAEQGIYTLFLKGAAATKAPDTLAVTMEVDDYGNDISAKFTLSKGELMHAYKMHAGNSYLRRLAEALRDNISTFAEKAGLNGDLGAQLNIESLKENREPLTARQKAWASSFNQGNPLLEATPELLTVAILLAQDFSRKTNSFNKGKKTKVSKPSPKRQNKPKNVKPNNVKKNNNNNNNSNNSNSKKNNKRN